MTAKRSRVISSRKFAGLFDGIRAFSQISPGRPCFFCLLLPLLLVRMLAAPKSEIPDHASFDLGWRFHLGETSQGATVACDDTGWREVDLPHDWSVEADFNQGQASATAFLPGGVGWYRKHFAVPVALRGQRITVTFDGVQRDSDVWINGVHLGRRPNGYIGFTYDLTPHLEFGDADNILAVRAERKSVADSRWFPGTGLYRHVWLTHTDPIHVVRDGVFVTSPRVTADRADIATTTEVVNESAKSATVDVTSRVLAPTGAVVSEAGSRQELAPGATYTFSDWQKLAAPQRWSPVSPVLYTLETIVRVGDTVRQTVRTPLGLRQFHFDPDRGFFLNGENLKLQGVCLHHDGGVVGAAVPDAMLERRLRLLKELGVNAVRCSHNPMAPEFYDLCDRLGLLVMDEAFDEWEIGKRKWKEGRNHGSAERFGYAAAFADWAERDLADQVRQHRNHPSIILWSLGNEIDYPTDPYVHPESRVDNDFKNFSAAGKPQAVHLTVVAPQLIATVKRWDPTRPVTMALANLPASNGTGLASMLDVVGYNYQEDRYAEDHAVFPNRMMLGSETSKSAASWHAVTKNSFISGEFIWTGFDFLGEAGVWPAHGSAAGLFDTCGFLKPSGYQFAAWWQTRPVVLVAVAPGVPPERPRRSVGQPRWTWPNDAGRDLRVTVFSNCATVELFLNGRSLGRQAPDETAAAVWAVPYEAGTLEAVGWRDGTEVARQTLRTAGPARRLAVNSDRSGLGGMRGVAHVVVEILDEQGVHVPAAEVMVTASVTGAGRLLGLDNGNLADPTPLRSAGRVTAEGRLLCLVQATAPTGKIRFRVTAPGLQPAELTLDSR